MAWTTLDTNGLLPGEPFTSAKALAFYENPIAIANGDSGAPKVKNVALDPIQTAIIANGAVTLAKLNIATRSFSGFLGASSSTTVSYGDAYAFAPVFSATALGNMTFSEGGFRISSGGNTINWSLSWRYLTA